MTGHLFFSQLLLPFHLLLHLFGQQRVFLLVFHLLQGHFLLVFLQKLLLFAAHSLLQGVELVLQGLLVLL